MQLKELNDEILKKSVQLHTVINAYPDLNATQVKFLKSEVGMLLDVINDYEKAILSVSK